MAIEQLTLEQFIELLRRQQGERTAKQFAQDLSVQPSYLSEIYNGRREPGPSVLRAVSASRHTLYTVDTPATTNEAVQPPPSPTGDPNEK